MVHQHGWGLPGTGHRLSSPLSSLQHGVQQAMVLHMCALFLDVLRVQPHGFQQQLLICMWHQANLMLTLSLALAVKVSVALLFLSPKHSSLLDYLLTS